MHRIELKLRGNHLEKRTRNQVKVIFFLILAFLLVYILQYHTIIYSSIPAAPAIGREINVKPKGLSLLRVWRQRLDARW